MYEEHVVFENLYRYIKCMAFSLKRNLTNFFFILVSYFSYNLFSIQKLLEALSQFFYKNKQKIQNHDLCFDYNLIRLN